MDDLIIRGGEIIDGTGAPARPGDVAVQNGRIVAIGDSTGREARRFIDARGQVIAPGFIDIHTHSDFTLPLNHRAESKIRQGVTTEVVGNCGYSTAPVLPGKVAMLQAYLAAGAPWLELAETSFGQYLDDFPATSVNTVMQVGHATLRLMTMGMDDRAPTSEEMAQMERLLDESLEAGALGMSCGLFTAPGNYAATEELVALARVLRRHGGTYASHVRDEANRVFEAVNEAISVGEAAGVRVQVAHLKLSGTDNWGRTQALLELIAKARERGVDVHCDQYPYTAGTNPLRNLLPLWVHAGGVEAMLARLTNSQVVDQIRTDIDRDGFTNFGRVESWDAVRISISASQPEIAGRTVGAIASERSCDPLQTACDILLADKGHTRIVVTSMSEEDVQDILRSPMVMVGSDGNSLATHGVTSQGSPHPRFYGTFPRVLGRYVRELGILPLPLAIYKMTGGSAAALRLRKRGSLQEGHWADITVFDPQEIGERSTYGDPHRYAAGVSTVVVNGQVVIEDGEHTGALPGRVLRRRTDGVV
jgi:N-acyl-D-amino-acid deacylase